MSKEFEVAVLKRLDSIDSRLDNQEKILNEHTKILNEHSQILNEHSQILNKHDKKFEEQNKKFSVIEKRLDRHDALFDKVLDELLGVQELAMQNHNILIQFEHDFNKKFDALFDSFVDNGRHHKSFKKDISSINASLINHDIRISAIEDTFKKQQIN